MMMPLFSGITRMSGKPLYALFRALVGFLFLQHGLQKLGMLEGAFEINGFMGFIGLCELLGGTAILLGIWTRLVAVLGTVLLVGAYTTAHMGNGLLPIQNKGELALLYIAAFIALFLYGAGKWSLERLLTKRELF